MKGCSHGSKMCTLWEIKNSFFFYMIVLRMQLADTFICNCSGIKVFLWQTKLLNESHHIEANSSINLCSSNLLICLVLGWSNLLKSSWLCWFLLYKRKDHGLWGSSILNESLTYNRMWTSLNKCFWEIWLHYQKM